MIAVSSGLMNACFGYEVEKDVSCGVGYLS